MVIKTFLLNRASLRKNQVIVSHQQKLLNAAAVYGQAELRWDNIGIVDRGLSANVGRRRLDLLSTE